MAAMTAEERRAYNRAWEANPDNRMRRIANKKAYRERNADKLKAYRDANKSRQKAWREANKEKVRGYNKAWHAANPGRAYAHSLKRRYNLTCEQYDAMFEAQGRACKCCGTTEPRSERPWHVDHCHKTGLVRGILCHHCNAMLGHAKDDPLHLLRGAQYLLLS